MADLRTYDPHYVHRVNSTESDDSDSLGGPALQLSRYTTNIDGSDDLIHGLHESESQDALPPLREPAASTHASISNASSSTLGNTPIAISSAMTSTYGSAGTSTPNTSWSSHSQSRGSRVPNGAGLNTINTTFDTHRPQRPPIPRTPSHTYAPLRRPSQFGYSYSQYRSSSGTRSRPNAEADYRAQKKVYAQRLKQQNLDNHRATSPEDYPPSLGYSTGSDTEDESPSTADHVENDPYDQETALYYGNEDIQPSVEEIKIPANRERLEWHTMLTNVLTGDVVRQEKKRIIGASEQQGDNALHVELWMGVRARTCGRTVPAQRRVVEDQRQQIPALIEEVVSFEIKGETEVGQGPGQQVEALVKKIEKIESLYPTLKLLQFSHPRVDSEAYKESTNAILSWHNTMSLINTELEVLRSWVGNDELDFSKPKEKHSDDDKLFDESSFVERILKEDGLKSLQGDRSMLDGVGNVIDKAKATLIRDASIFSDKHLPPYIEELLTLINFPSRLVQEIIRMRLSYTKNIRDPAEKGVMMAEQLISEFQILLTLAVRIKNAYIQISKAEPGWDLPPCIDDNFDTVVTDALRFYFKMLNWKLSANKNTFKEAEILEQEWGFSSGLGRHFQGGDVEVAEQFSSLTSKSLHRLTAHFEKELQRRPNEVAGPEMDRRYKQMLDSVRVRQRKLFRFSRLLTQTFENAAEYSIQMNSELLNELFEDLTVSGHILLNLRSKEHEDILVLASPTLIEENRNAESFLASAYHAERSGNKSFPYLLMLYPDIAVTWEGHRADADFRMPMLDMKPGKLRLVAEGASSILQGTKDAFTRTLRYELDLIMPQRANLPNVDKELQKIKRTAWKLSTSIMDSVEVIRKQLAGLECQELIQTCFAFATEFGQRSVLYMDHNRKALNNLKLTHLALDWVSFICDDCKAMGKKTFRWAVNALEFAMVMTRGQNILSISDEEYEKLRFKVSSCMSLLISHFDIMGARSTMAAQAESQRSFEAMGGKSKLDITKLKDDEESSRIIRQQWMERIQELDSQYNTRASDNNNTLGRVLESSTEADRSLTNLAASATNVTMRWQQNQYIGGGTFGSVYVATNMDNNTAMAVKEIRLQDPQLIPNIVGQIRDEMGVLQILDHPNIVQYYGIEVHRDKVYIFMEYCAGGSLAALLEHGRIEDEMVIQVYALQLLEGLAYLHESHVVHRDIKPENILMDWSGVIKYVDFGAAKVIAQQTSKTMAANGGGGKRGERRVAQKSMTGTPMYMSPEVIRGNTVSSGGSSGSSSTATSPLGSPGAPPRFGSVDIWSLGCVVLEMATGHRPWGNLDNEWAIMYNIAQGNPPQMPTSEQMSESGIDFLKRCFEREPSRRATAAELLQHEWIMLIRNKFQLQNPADSPGLTHSGSSMSSTSMYTDGSNGVSPTA